MHGKSYENESHQATAHSSFEKVEDFLKNHENLLAGGSYLFKCSHNKFSDFSIGDFIKSFMGFDADQHKEKHDSSKFDLDKNGLPKAVDWREKGYVNAVQNQGQCGCCYTFAACAAMEGQYFKKNGKLIKLSGIN